MNKYIIGGGFIADGKGLFIEDGAILIEDNKIAKIGHLEDMKDLSENFIGLEGRLVMPGFVNPHHHLYSALAAGLSPLGVPKDFREILEYLWWPLDRALDEESVYYSAMTGIIDSIRHGVTMISDHHASMNFVDGSLETIAKAFQKAEIRGLLCFETSDRMGDDEVDRHIRENIDFYEKYRDDKFLGGTFGMHANFTLSEKSMQKIAASKPAEMPVHVHIAEDGYDATYCRRLGYDGAFDRLLKFELADENSLIGHAIHLGGGEFKLLNDIGPFVIENAESNANNDVGMMDNSKVDKFIIGTDGMSSDIIASWRSHYLLKGGGDMSYFGNVIDEISRMKAHFFPGTESLSEGSIADIAVLDYKPKTPISNDNLIGHLIFGARSALAYMTICDGKIIYRDGDFKTINIDEYYKNIRPVAQKLWKKFGN